MCQKRCLASWATACRYALRAFTPRDQKAVKGRGLQTMRANPGLDTATAITELGVGEALISLLDEKGRPQPVERAFILPPASRIGPVTDAERAAIVKSSIIFGHYEQTVDRESAYEKQGRVAAKQDNPAVPGAPPCTRCAGIWLAAACSAHLSEALLGKTGPRGGHTPGILADAAAKSAARH